MADTTELEDAVTFLKKRIKAVRQSVAEIETRMREHDRLIERGGDGYDVDALRESNEHNQLQVDRLSQEVSKMQTQIASNRKMMEFLETKAIVSEGIVIDADAHD